MFGFCAKNKLFLFFFRSPNCSYKDRLWNV